MRLFTRGAEILERRASATRSWTRGMRERVEDGAVLKWALPATVLAVVAVLPIGLPSFWQSLLVDTLLFVLLALGLNVVVGFAGLLDLGFVAFYAIGHYAYAIPTAGEFSKGLILRGGKDLPPVPVWENWMWLLLFVGIAAAMIAGVILGGPTLRLRGDYLAIVTLGFGEIVRIAARNFDGITLGSRGINRVPNPVIGSFDFSTSWVGYYYLLLVLTVIVIVAIVNLNHSRVGRSWHAIREDEIAAEAMGVDTLKMKLWAFAIGASTAGIAGAVQASRIGFVSPDEFTLLISIFILSMVVLGGMGSIVGAIVGAAIIKIVPEYLRTRSQDFQLYYDLIFGAVLVVMMIFRPQGLFPSRRRAIELGGDVREGGLYEAGLSPQATVGEQGGDRGAP